MKTKTRENKESQANSKLSITKVPAKIQSEITVNCQAHGEVMNRVGRSERGLPLYFCERGCMAEVGVGRVKKIKARDGYGFIYKEGKDMFFHFSDLVADSVKRGDLVSFKVGYNKRKERLQAVQVQSLKELRRDKR